MGGPLNLQLANPVEAGINSYAKLKGVQMAEDELAMKKSQQAQDNAWKEKEMGWKGEEAARSATTFQNVQTDRENQMLAASLRPIQAKLGQNWSSGANLLDGVSVEEQDIIKKTPQGRALLQMIQGQRGAIDGAIAKFKAGDTRGLAQTFNSLYPGQINRGDSVVHPGVDILDVAKQWRDPNAPEFGMVKVDQQGKVLAPTDQNYADPNARWVKIGKEATDVQLSPDGSAYTANVLTTTVDPSNGSIVMYEAPMTEGRTTGAPVTWKPVEHLINDVVQRKGLLDFADQYGLSVNDPVSKDLYVKQRENDMALGMKEKEGRLGNKLSAEKSAQEEQTRKERVKPALDTLDGMIANAKDDSTRQALVLMRTGVETGEEKLSGPWMQFLAHQDAIKAREQEYSLRIKAMNDAKEQSNATKELTVLQAISTAPDKLISQRANIMSRKAAAMQMGNAADIKKADDDLAALDAQINTSLAKAKKAEDKLNSLLGLSADKSPGASGNAEADYAAIQKEIASGGSGKSKPPAAGSQASIKKGGDKKETLGAASRKFPRARAALDVARSFYDNTHPPLEFGVSDAAKTALSVPGKINSSVLGGIADKIIERSGQ